MSETFYVKIKDEVKHRIIIDIDAWKKLKLKKGDFVKVTVEKLEK